MFGEEYPNFSSNHSQIVSLVIEKGMAWTVVLWDDIGLNWGDWKWVLQPDLRDETWAKTKSLLLLQRESTLPLLKAYSASCDTAISGALELGILSMLRSPNMNHPWESMFEANG